MAIFTLFAVLTSFAGGLITTTPVDGQTVSTIITVGDTPEGVDVNPLTNKVYVANFNDDTVSVIDGATDTIMSTVNVGDLPINIGVNSKTNTIFVGNLLDDTVSVIDGATDTVVGTIKGIFRPTAIGVNPSTNKIYVSSAWNLTAGKEVFVIDGATNSIINTVTVGIGPVSIGVNPTTNKIYVSNILSATVSVIDGSIDKVVATISIPFPPTQGQPGNEHVGVNTATNKIYITNSIQNTVSVIDGLTNMVVDTITGLHGPIGIDVNSLTNKIYVGNAAGPSVSILDGATNLILFSVTVGYGPYDIGINAKTNKAYVSSAITNGRVYVISEQKNNDPPNCTAAKSSPSSLWPPNHMMMNILVKGVTDPDNDPVSITITGISQDEPTSGLGSGDKSPDGSGLGTNIANIRSERAGTGDGRVYHIGFTAGDGKGGMCSGEVVVLVPHNQGQTAIDSGSIYDSTIK